MKIETRKQYSMAFKVAAVQKSINSPFTVKSVAEGLNIRPQLLTKWRGLLVTKAKPSAIVVENSGPDKSYADLEQENRELKKRLERAELESTILKKAKEYFDKKLR